MLPEASFAWASADNPERARASAWRSWSNPYGHEANDAYLQLMLRAGFAAPIDEPEFAECAQRLYGTLLQHEAEA